jgi:hypothetical protein
MNGLERFEQSPVMMIEQQQHMIEQEKDIKMQILMILSVQQLNHSYRRLKVE